MSAEDKCRCGHDRELHDPVCCCGCESYVPVTTMSDEKTSPGPWRWDGSRLLDANGGQVLSWSMTKADENLIADAPAMLELLRKHEFAAWDNEPCCPECLQPQDTNPSYPRHVSTCALGALLDKHGRTG